MPKTILFTGGGTSGHLMPLLTVIAEVEKQAPEVRCVYVGSHSDLASSQLDKYPHLERVEAYSGKLHRYPTFKQIGEIFRLGRGLAQADRLVKKIDPSVIFAKGGAITVPIVLAGARQHRTIFSHESDVRAGLANRIAARYARTVFTAYPAENYPQLDRKKLLCVGQPVRPDFFDRATVTILHVGERTLPTGVPILLVMGGSQGAHQINILIQKVWSKLLATSIIIHQCGARDHVGLEKQAAELSLVEQERLFLTPFIGDELPELMRSATLVVTRSGGTVAELAASGAASLLIPLPSAAQDHQRANANLFLRAGAALVIEETNLDAQTLADEIGIAMNNSDQLHELRQAIQLFAKPDAAKEIARALIRAL